MMAILVLNTTPGLAEVYKPLLQEELPGMAIRTWPDDTGDLAEIAYAVVGLPEPGLLQRCPNLRAILSTWAGVDRLLADPTFPRHLPLSRMVDPLLAVDMSHFAIHWVLHFHRNIHLHLAAQREARWEQIRYPEGFDHNIVDVFNTNTLTFSAEALDREFDLGWYYVEKKVEGRKAVQVEHLIGEMTAHLSTSFLQVRRSGPDTRFLPVKTPDDLEAAQEEIAEIYDGVEPE